MKTQEAKFIIENDKLGKSTIKFEVPSDLRKLNNKQDKYEVIVGIGKWLNSESVFVAISKGKEIAYLSKEVWLEIAESLRKIK